MVWQAVVIGFLKSVAINLAISLALAAIQGRGRSEGPRLEDLSIQTSTYGRFIPIIYGTPPKISGNVIWLKDGQIKETRHKKTVGDIFGIGGTDIITYTYSATFAVAVCDGPARVRRMWAGTTLIYDEGLVTESNLREEFTNFITGALVTAGHLPQRKFSESLLYAAGELDDLRVYKGTETQSPDFRILEEDPNTPAYRNTTYVVFDELQLKKYGNQIPQLYFEIVADDDDDYPDRLLENDLDAHPYANRYYPVSFSGGVLRIQESRFSEVTSNTMLLDAIGDYIGQEFHTGIAPPVPHKNLGFLGTGLIQFANETSASAAYPASLLWKSKANEDINFDVLASLNIVTELLGVIFSADDQYMLLLCNDNPGSPLPGNGQNVDVEEWRLVQVSGFNDATLVDSGTASGVEGASRSNNLGWKKGGEPGYGSNDYRSACLEDNLKYFWTVYSAGSGEVKLYWIDEKNVLTEVGPAKWKESGAGNTGGYGGIQFGAPFIYANAGKAIIGGGKDFGGGNFGTWTGAFSRRAQVEQDATTDGAVITDLCTRAGLTAADINVTERTSEIKGYAIGNLSSLGSAIEPMQGVTYFDVTESDMKLKFPSRGGSSVVTLTSDDVAAYEYGSERPQELTQKRAQETGLPNQIAVSYSDRDRNYDQSEQYSSRLVKDSERVNKIQLPIVVDADKAAQVADVNLYNMWAERNTFEFSLPYKFAYLDAGDLVTLSLDQTHIVRLTEVQLGANLIKCKAVAERADLYNSVAVGQAGTPATIKGFAGETHIEFLDIPILRESEEDDSGFYIACGGYYPGWAGCQVWKASADGQPYTELVGVTEETTMGYSTDTLADANNTTVTDDTTVIIKPFNGKTLSTISDFTGNDNIAAIGDHGRWELIRYLTATDNSDGTYTLSNLLRGYRGTEHNTGNHVALDKFVLLSGSSLVRVNGDDADINVERYYKAQTIGDDVSQAIGRAFTNTAVGLKPYAPANIQGTRSGGDLTITWTRRSRTGWFWLNSIACPLDQDTESYEIDIVNTASPGVVLRTITASTETATYTAAQQATDFGSPQPASVNVRIYQISDNATIDRGYVGEATI